MRTWTLNVVEFANTTIIEADGPDLGRYEKDLEVVELSEHEAEVKKLQDKIDELEAESQ